MAKREINVFNIAFLDLISGALGAVIILYVAVPKNEVEVIEKEKYEVVTQERDAISLESDEKDVTIKKLQDEIEKNKEMQAKHKEEMKKAKETLEKLGSLKKESEAKSKNESVEDKTKSVGFDFKGKNIIFLIDVSGSMEEERLIDEVKAGLKMFVTSLTEDYSVDVVFFPDGIDSSYRPLWGRTKEMNKKNKEDVYTYLSGLIPFGATPTRDVLHYALENYSDATDIVLMSDGAPSRPNSPQMENIDNIITEITKKNDGRIQINTLGVGPHFRFGERRSSQLYRFLNKLSEENNGFFHGF